MSGFGKLATGTVIANDFEVVRPLSEGGMGAVYVVKQKSTGHERALKVMHPQMTANASLREKFIREAKISAVIESEHVVQVLSAGIDDASGTPWLVMELLRGRVLSEFIEEGGRPDVAVSREIFRQLCHGLGAAHAVGVVHRDLKPENIFLAKSKRSMTNLTVKILDFGIAKIAAEAKTHGSMAIGSPYWMAPEQAQVGVEINPATDVWALGLVAFFVLTGKNFWRSAQVPDATPVMVMKEMIFDEILPASARAKELGCETFLPADFDAWFARCVVRDGAKRFANADAAHAAFERLFPGDGATPSGPVQVDLGSTGDRGSRSGGTVQGTPLPDAVPVARTTEGSPDASYVAGARPRSAVDDATFRGASYTEPRAPLPVAPAAPTERGGPSSKSLSKAWLAVPAFAFTAGAVWFASGRFGNSAESRRARADSAAPAPSSSAPPKEDKSVEGLRLLWDATDAANPAKAVALLKQACSDGFQDGCAGVGLATYRGVGATANVAAGAKLLDAACTAGSQVGCAGFGNALVLGKGIAKDPKRGIELLEKACDGGVVGGCTWLGLAYESGDGTPKDVEMANKLFDKACTANEGMGCTDLGANYVDGAGVPKDGKRALELHEKACGLGIMIGCSNAGQMNSLGESVAKDAARANQFFEKVFASGDMSACDHLGLQYLNGWSALTKDVPRANAAFEKACTGGNMEACTDLAFDCLNGDGTTVDLSRAEKLLEEVCATDPHQCTNAGVSFYFGVEGVAQPYVWQDGAPRVKKDLPRADALYQKACDSGDGDGCAYLGEAYFRGDGQLAMDINRANQLFDKACAAGSMHGCGWLGSDCLYGRGLAPDRARAVDLLTRACKGGNGDACTLLVGLHVPSPGGANLGAEQTAPAAPAVVPKAECATAADCPGPQFAGVGQVSCTAGRCTYPGAFCGTGTVLCGANCVCPVNSQNFGSGCVCNGGFHLALCDGTPCEGSACNPNFMCAPQ